jgi:hypothetical protein
VIAVAAGFNGREISPDKLGRFLSGYCDRIVGGYELTRVGISHKATQWQIIRHPEALDYEDEIISTSQPDKANVVTLDRRKLVPDPYVAEIAKMFLMQKRIPDDQVCEPIAISASDSAVVMVWTFK